MLASGLVTTTVVFQLILGFCVVILAAYSAVCFGAELAYGVIWWSFGWTLVIACLRWWTSDLHRGPLEQLLHLCFELFAAISWIVATGVLVSENIHLHHLKNEYDYDNAHGLPLTGSLITHQFNAVGRGGLITSIVANAVTGVIFLLFVLSTYDSIRHLNRARRMKKNEDFEKQYNDEKMSRHAMSTDDHLVRNVASSQMLASPATMSRLHSLREE